MNLSPYILRYSCLNNCCDRFLREIVDHIYPVQATFPDGKVSEDAWYFPEPPNRMCTSCLQILRHTIPERKEQG